MTFYFDLENPNISGSADSVPFIAEKQGCGSHHFNAFPGPAFHSNVDPDPAFTLIRIRIQLFTLMRIWIQLFTLMRIRIQLFTVMRIRIQLFSPMRIRMRILIKVMGIFDRIRNPAEKNAYLNGLNSCIQ